MQNLFSQLWNDDEGIVALEYLILATILGLGLIVGITALTAALNAEYHELASAILSFNQSVSSAAMSNCVSFHGGFNVLDVQGTFTSGNTIPLPAVQIDTALCTGLTTTA